MRFLLVVTSETYPFELVCFVCEKYDEIIIPWGMGSYELSEFCADAMQKSKHVIRPKYHLYEKNEAIEQRNREMVEYADAVLIVRGERSEGEDQIINCAGELGKKPEVVCTR